MVDSEYTELKAKVNIRVSKAFPNWHLHDSDANVLHGGILEIIPEICSTVIKLRRCGRCAVCQFAIDDWRELTCALSPTSVILTLILSSCEKAIPFRNSNCRCKLGRFKEIESLWDEFAGYCCQASAMENIWDF